MSQFVKHEACEQCGSSDAKGVYKDGSTFCFSCNKLGGARVNPHEQAAHAEVVKRILLPPDANNDYGAEAVAWVAQYDVSVAELIRHNVKWSEKYKQLIFFWYHQEIPSRIGCIQARNFYKGGKKYYNQGRPSDVLPIYRHVNNSGKRIVITEDVISAIRVSRNEDAMPLLGSYLSKDKILTFKQCAYSEVVFWLDHDKYAEAVHYGDLIKMIGMRSRVIRTDLDPKCYSDLDIMRNLE